MRKESENGIAAVRDRDPVSFLEILERNVGNFGYFRWDLLIFTRLSSCMRLWRCSRMKIVRSSADSLLESSSKIPYSIIIMEKTVLTFGK